MKFLSSLILLILSPIAFAEITTVEVYNRLTNPVLNDMVQKSAWNKLVFKQKDAEAIMVGMSHDSIITKIEKDGNKTVALVVLTQIAFIMDINGQMTEQIDSDCYTRLEKQTDGNYADKGTHCSVMPIAVYEYFTNSLNPYFE